MNILNYTRADLLETARSAIEAQIELFQEYHDHNEPETFDPYTIRDLAIDSIQQLVGELVADLENEIHNAVIVKRYEIIMDDE